jgi:hypothetical protein
MLNLNLTLGDTELILEVCKKYKLSKFKTAYVLATAYHETAHTMKPVKEYGGETYLKSKKYYPYVGMGYVQLTWKENYEKASKKLNVDFVKNPALLLKPQYAAPILVIGMIEGWFTGKKLSSYIDDIEENATEDMREFKESRRIINGIDKAQLIAGYAMEYYKLLVKASNSPVETPKDYPVPIQPKLPEAPVKAFKPGFWTFVADMLMKLFKRK